MSLIDWQDEFEIGIEPVDDDHKELVDLINAIHEELIGAKASDRLQRFFHQLHTAISEHFALEERIMGGLGYDDVDAHKTDHEQLLNEIQGIMERQARGGYAGSETDLAHRLRAWFMDHFSAMDAPLHVFLDSASGRGKS
jgi:hemerythrin